MNPFKFCKEDRQYLKKIYKALPPEVKTCLKRLTAGQKRIKKYSLVTLAQWEGPSFPKVMNAATYSNVDHVLLSLFVVDRSQVTRSEYDCVARVLDWLQEHYRIRILEYHYNQAMKGCCSKQGYDLIIEHMKQKLKHRQAITPPTFKGE